MMENELEHIENQDPLPPMLNEFRTALTEEIEASKILEINNAIPLSNGHKIGYMAGMYQYSFLIETVINAPSESPAELRVDGYKPLSVIIVSVEGLKVTISLDKDLGKFVSSASLYTNLTMLMEKLIKRIEENAFRSNPAADRMLGKAKHSGVPSIYTGVSELHENQLNALESALGRNLTFIQGPPGTGKTFIIGEIANQLYQMDRTVLIVSHTNIAIDQAIKNVAKSLESEIETGLIIRVGEIKDKELSDKYESVLLKKQAELQSKIYADKRDELSLERDLKEKEKWLVERKLFALDWLSRVPIVFHEIEADYGKLQEVTKEKQQAESYYNELQREYPIISVKYDKAQKAVQVFKEIDTLNQEEQKLQNSMKLETIKLDELWNEIEEQRKRLSILKRIQPLREELASYPSEDQQREIINKISAKRRQAEEDVAELSEKLKEASDELFKALNANVISRIIKRLPKPEDQKIFVNELQDKLSEYRNSLMGITQAQNNANKTHSRILELDAELSEYTYIGSPEQETKIMNQAEKKVKKIRNNKEQISIRLNDIQKEINELNAKYQQYSMDLSTDPLILFQELDNKMRQYRQFPVIIREHKGRINYLQRKISDKIEQEAKAIEKIEEAVEIQLTISYYHQTIQEKYDWLTDMYDTILKRCKHLNVGELQDKLRLISGKITQIYEEIAEIDAILAAVEKQIIANAAILGATLTKTYLSDDIQARKFDTVILDEASMAPIPALWIAALLSENNLIIIGDPKQLPPIVISEKEMAKRWLGRDIFKVADLDDAWDSENHPEYFVKLTEQRRMSAELMNVVNLFYKGKLRVAEDFTTDESFFDWYNKPSYDNPVILVDTGSLNAWVTSVTRGRKTSRLNILSATTSVDLAEQLLKSDRVVEEGSPTNKILIISPYNPHAKLVNALIKENDNIHEEVVAGTVHSFQGSEADVVIFDLVADEPHFRVNLFWADLDEQMKPLFNVGLSRAKNRLYILGDFSYCLKKGRHSFLGRELLPYLLDHFSKEDAAQILPEGLAAKAAKAQLTLLGGDIEPDSERIVVTQAAFYKLFLKDIARAEKEVIIFSPFITRERVAFLLHQIRGATERGVSVFVVTKAIKERNKKERVEIIEAEKILMDAGAAFIYKMRMHEKVVFIDDDIIWTGSLNPLSFSNTQEIMERRNSKLVVENYKTILKLDDLLSIHRKKEDVCPICGDLIVAAEGRDEPFYWRCIQDECYTRSINLPYPREGIINCSNCDAPVYFGYWGKSPSWRCTVNKRHHQKMYKSHLRLPKMANLIPSEEIKNVYKYFRISVEKAAQNYSEHALLHNTKSKLEKLADDSSLNKDSTTQMKLHEAMAKVLKEKPFQAATPKEISQIIAQRDLYKRPSDGGHAPPNQISARARQYPKLFSKLTDGRIQLDK